MLTRFAVLILVSSIMFAQPPRGPRPWWDGEIRRDLNLSDSQTKQIRQTREEFRPHMIEIRDTVNKAEADVEAAFNEDPVDQAKASEAINRLAAARAEVFKTMSQMDLRMRMILTAQQWQDLKEKQRRPWPGGPGSRRGLPRGGTPPTTSNQQK